MVARYCGVLLVLSGLSSVWAADQPRPLAAEEALAQLAFAFRIPIDVSPDGQRVAYTIQDFRRIEYAGERRFSLFGRTGAPAEAQGCDVWITDIARGRSKNLTGGLGTSWAPVWSPDGRTLGYYSDRGGRRELTRRPKHDTTPRTWRRNRRRLSIAREGRPGQTGRHAELLDGPLAGRSRTHRRGNRQRQAHRSGRATARLLDFS
jgi:WD40-like Beta Propeller Repeat